MVNKYREIWNKLHKEFSEKHEVKYDDWLVEFDDIIESTKLPIIDLGCGSTANNTYYLLEKGQRVISCDFSQEALNVVKTIKGSETQLFDMFEKFPFEDNSTDIVIADLSLHYFREKDTFEILDKIKSILTPNGHLFFRLNSTNSTEYKNLKKDNVEEVEHHLYCTNNMEKRFFDKKDIEKFFTGWSSVIEPRELNMTRWSSDKIVWVGVVQVNK